MDTNDGQTEPSSEGGFNIGWIDPGDWLDYPVEVKESGLYKVSYRIAGPNAQGTIELRAQDSTLVSTSMQSTGDWQEWSTVESEPFTLEAGSKLLRVYFNGSGFNLNWIRFEHVQAKEE
ncbi:carbohydrate-binding protein [Paenibacillus sp. JCM 10914]|uniref:carbohydrate-binding protein n=1 Tax=Paenibacillus sp. JCM 10914 TaxID=1236974 RepID=UPI00351BF68C